MTSTFSTNKGFEEPAFGDYVNAWATPVNSNWTAIDASLGGTTSISVTGIVAPTTTLTLTQYRPPNIEFTGTLTANLAYQIPAGIGGMWSVNNATTGAFTLSFSITAGNSLTLASGRTLIVSDGTTVALADARPANNPYPQTPPEALAGVIPTNTVYLPGDVRRYGADPTGILDSSVAFQSSTNVGQTVLIPAGIFKVTGVSYVGKVVWVGQGTYSKILSDSVVLAVTGGTGSEIDNLWMENITPPWIITRNPLNWAADISGTLQQSNGNGYQPTINDTDIWNTLSPSQQNQQIGPTITFTGNSTDITVSRIYGRSVVVTIMDSQFSQFRDCDIRGGKGVWGGLVFDNATNNTLQGLGNSAVGCIVRYSSFSGIIFLNNNRPLASSNECLLNGESGIKAAVGPNNTICIYGNIIGNSCSDNFYDGIDCVPNFPADDSIPCYHNVVGNYSYRNGGDGINIAGQFNNCIGNLVHFNYRYGIWCVASLSNICNNSVNDNNQSRNPSFAEILGGNVNNVINGNRIWSGAGQNVAAIFAQNTNYITDNYAIGSNFNFGATPATTTSYLDGNIDSTIGLAVQQSFVLGISNNSGTLQHSTYAQSGAVSLGNFQSRILNASATPANTPTGPDSSTALAAGWKIGSAATGNIWADTNNQLSSANANLMCSVAYNDTGNMCYVRPQIVSININGVTRFRLTFQFTKPDGTSFVLNTTNIPSGKTIQVQFLGNLT